MIKIGEMRETGSVRFPRVWLTKDGSRKNNYIVMLQVYNAEQDRVSGWMTAKDGSLKDCRKYIAQL